ncbi:choice-of-anchor I family protein [Microbacterium sp. W1N]|uniref:choice-of-anchor I family protein n=1 Tax=Microbacterium festucae TaxID=2977531 RepID=UPI0021C04901|nr:choice-of-anchor I family protein [Microbacterium festucae]MCT9819733.1 choice-of-anchor I family protein [Microbacterium festucae]
MPSPVRRRAVAAAITAALACTLALTPLTAAAAAPATPAPVVHSAADAALTLTPLGTHATSVFGASAAEIVAAHGDRLFVVNAQAGSITVLDYRDPASPVELFEIAADGVANSVAVRADGLGVIALESPTKTDPGALVFFDADAAEARILGSVTVGALPDMVTISSDGAYAVVANEGEPADDFSTDPEGSVGVVALPTGKTAPAQEAVRLAGFAAFEGENLPGGVRVFGPDVAAPDQGDTPLAANRVSRNLEPEYIAVDGGTAYAAVQEANAIAVVDLASATVTDLFPLGFKDHGLPGNGLDASDRDNAIDIAAYPGLKGIYMPDGMSSYQAGGTTYLVTANEGDAREWGDYIDEARVKDLGKKQQKPICTTSPLAALTADADLGRLKIATDLGIADGADCYSELYAYGARSFSIWTTDGEQVFDSGDQFEQITAAAIPDHFDSGHDETGFDTRSAAKGPEPENVAVGTVGGRTYAFVGLERVGGIMVYDITDPAASRFVTYVNNRDFSAGEEPSAASLDLGAEGVTFIPAERSATGEPLLAVANEVSGTTTLFAIDGAPAEPQTTDIQVLTINDFHGRIEQNLANGEAGAAVLAGAVDDFEKTNPNTLLVSAGDNIGASTFTSFIQQDTPTIAALKAAGLDVGAVGNHEFDAGFADLTDRVTPGLGGSHLSLGANVYLKGTKTPALDEYRVETVDGVRIAFIGTVTQQTAAMVTPTGIAGIEFGDQLEAVDRVAAKITDGDLADVIVLLTHEGPATGSCDAVAGDTTVFGDLIRGASAEVDAIVTGHTHQSFACEVAGPAGPRPVIQAHQYGTTLGKLDISVDTASKELVSVTPSLVPLVADGKAAFPADPAVAQIVADAVAVAETEGKVEVGRISDSITRGGTAGSDRGVESTLGNTVADLYLWATSNDDYAGTPAQIGLMNPGGLRADLVKTGDGTVTVRDVANVQPFANTLVTVTLTGAQLKAVLEEQWQPDGSSRPKLHLGVSAGFAYTYDPAAPRGQRIVSMSLDGAPITAADAVTVVTNSFLAAGGDNFVTFAQGTDRTDTGQVDLQATVAYFASRDVVAPAPLGRAALASGENPGGENPGGENPGGENPGENPGGELPGTGGPTAAELGAALEKAVIEFGSGRVEQGGSFEVEIAGLLPGQQISATLFSDPIVITGIPAANANGQVSFTVAIPASLPTGAHRLVLVSGDGEVTLGVIVLAGGTLAATGGTFPIGFVSVLAAGLLAAGLVMVLRRRATA